MKTRNRLLATILGIAILAALGAVFAMPLAPATVLAAHTAGAGMSRHHGGGHCAHLGEETGALLEAYLEITLELTEPQKAALAPVIDVVDGWRVVAEQSCDHAAFSDAPDALRALTALVAHTSESLGALGPAFDAFYRSLTPEQQSEMNAWIGHSHGS